MEIESNQYMRSVKSIRSALMSLITQTMIVQFVVHTLVSTNNKL